MSPRTWLTVCASVVVVTAALADEPQRAGPPSVTAALATTWRSQVSHENAVLAERIAIVQLHDKDRILKAMTEPLKRQIQAMSPQSGEKVRITVDEGVVPLLASHWGELVDITAGSYAKSLTTSDLAALDRFYQTAQGRRIAVAQAEINATQMDALTAFMERLRPEVAERVRALNEAHHLGPTPATQPSATPSR